jgi:PKD repeat protein
VFEGSIPLLDIADPALTDFTATPTGLSVEFVPVPAGTDPVWYEFGDGEWDLAETGSYTHVYEAAGTYEVVARRGGSRVTETVTVTA